MKEIIIKSQETREGVRFRILKDGKYLFPHINFNNYFYVKSDDYEINKEDLHKKFTFCLEKTEPIGQFTRIYLSNNFMRHKVRNWWEEKNIKTYEADIKANKRYLLDKNLNLNNESIPYLFFDIETDDRLPLVKDERGNIVAKSRILSYSSVNDKGKAVYFPLIEDNDEAEIHLLQNILEDFAKYGIIAGWNSSRFDKPYIMQRCEELGINTQILDYINHIDYMEIFTKYDKKSRPSNSLNAISNEILKESKIDQKKGEGAIYNTWKDNPEHLERYNIEDSNLIYKMNKKLMFIEVSMHRAKNAGCHVTDTMYNHHSGDYMIMREYKKENIIMPSEPNREEKLERKKFGSISGGFTRCLQPGFYKKMDVWDYKSFYPAVVKTFNIGPETYIETLNVEHEDGSDYPDFIITPTNFNEERQRLHHNRVFRKKEGVFAKLAERLVKERDKIKYSMQEFKESDPAKYRQMYLEQYALKVDANSYFFGVLAFPNSRYFNWQVADTITTCCQRIIKESYTKLTEWGCQVLGGDTDSTFTIVNDKTPEQIDKLFVEFYAEFVTRWNVNEHAIVFEHERTVEPFFFVMKKNYAFKEGDEIVIKGMECIKSDSAPIAAKMQREFIVDALNYTVNTEEWEKKFDLMRDKVFNQELLVNDLTLVKGLTKMPEDYRGYTIDSKTGQPKIKADGTKQEKAIPAHVKLAERMMSSGKDLYPGSKIKFVVIKDKPILAITPDEFMKGEGIYKTKNKKKQELDFYFEGDYDADYYWKRLLKPVVKVLHPFYGKLPEWEYGLTEAQVAKLIKSKDED